ncbi:adenine phosphoribosyltransferase [Christiangramia flava]|uniref:Adenine phosphoribosyltransferase n=1 Tax=Christiangramia flava JLT2011 TaxID=1229726 RepID=A0A1L7I5Y6_9FLAO|nr:adenine phosphoribosyltransferase [Christiangramia flava]APU69019.1 Adenine phosphoribosyltransferase [Christiangramia flava JLT2011]OSS38507.1 Adenine phosphoribosyltransferase [Christiangramia flava JLT2011]
MELKEFVRDIPDFPKKGVIYKDITPLLLAPKAVNQALEQFLENIGQQPIDKVVGIESRGFFFATLLAQRLDAGFIPVRKPGKLPASTHAQEYELEYGSDTLEIHKDAIQPGDKVLLHDDVLATGGTAAATCKLIEKCGGEIVLCNFLIELDFLRGQEQLKACTVHSLMHY